MDAPLAFHAAPPAGHWLNDPNGLVHAGGAYRLFAQHRVDAPAFRETGWARFSSPDLLRWRYDGVAIPAEGADWAYSGSIQAIPGGLAAVHTLHRDGLERQVRRVSRDGMAWSAGEPLPALGAAARNRRDPFLFRDRGGWALLLAEPCDWTEWRGEPASRLRLYRQEDGGRWHEAGVIGPWHAPGVMWEVPLLVRIDGRDVLFVSTVDRRGDGAACAVRAWVGTLHEDGFKRDAEAGADGQSVDGGPDFYALMASVEEGWTAPERAFVAWAGSWDTARGRHWPGFHGGPITLPRALTVEARPEGPWLANRPLAGLLDAFHEQAPEVPIAGVGTARFGGEATRIELTIAGDSEALTVAIDPVAGAAIVERGGGAGTRWSGRTRFPPVAAPERSVALFVDGPLVELFLIEEGVAVSAAVGDGRAPFTVSLRIDGADVALGWRMLGA